MSCYVGGRTPYKVGAPAARLACIQAGASSGSRCMPNSKKCTGHTWCCSEINRLAHSLSPRDDQVCSYIRRSPWNSVLAILRPQQLQGGAFFIDEAPSFRNRRTRTGTQFHRSLGVHTDTGQGLSVLMVMLSMRTKHFSPGAGAASARGKRTSASS